MDIIMSDMKQLDARQELLVITMEECGELIQACSKALRRGELFAYSDSETELKQEIAEFYGSYKVEGEEVTFQSEHGRFDLATLYYIYQHLCYNFELSQKNQIVEAILTGKPDKPDSEENEILSLDITKSPFYIAFNPSS